MMRSSFNILISKGKVIMIKYERLEQIRVILREQKLVNIASLSKQLGVSEVTIRNDLNALEREGFLQRTHGGAVLCPDYTPISLGDQLDFKLSPEKVAIGKTAAGLICPGEWVFLGSGTTCTAVAYALLDRPGINVITNNLVIALLLSRNKTSTVIVTNGQLQHERLLLGGELFSRTFDNIYVNKAFFGVSAVDLHRGYFVSQGVEINIFDTVRAVASETCIVADSSKFGKHSLTCSGGLDAADNVICDRGMPQAFQEKYAQLGVNVYFPAE